MPAGEIAGRALELGDVIGDRAAARLAERVHAAPDWSTRCGLVEEMLLGQLERHQRRRDVRPEVRRAWDRLSASGGTARVRDVAAEVGWSTRHLEQAFASAVGLPPKTVGRIMRFERSAGLVVAGADLGLVAIRCGYADQAHLTREWRRLAGTPPARWMRDDVLANVQDSHRASDEDRLHGHTH